VIALSISVKRRFGIIENGSWAPTAGKVMRSMIEGLKDCEIVEPMVTIRSRMKVADEVMPSSSVKAKNSGAI
jgi:hypothetical protein